MASSAARTQDLGGTASTQQAGDAIIALLDQTHEEARELASAS